MKKLLLILLFNLLAWPFLSSAAEEKSKEAPSKNVVLYKAEEQLQGRQYELALKSLESYLGKAESHQKDYAAYLKILANYYLKKDDQAVFLGKSFPKDYPQSKWLAKSHFLLAQTYIRQKKHQLANAIYEAETKRLFALNRQESQASLLINFAEALAQEPAAGDLESPPPNYNKAYQLYTRVLQMEIGRDMKDKVQYQIARSLQKMENYAAAEKAYRQYLDEFDPTWSGAVGSPERFRGQLKAKPGAAGKYRYEARFYLVEVQLNQCGQQVVITRGLRHQKVIVSNNAQAHLPRLKVARQNIEDLISLLKKEGQGAAAMTADAYWTKVRTYNMPHPSSLEVDAAVDTARDFGKLFPKHPRATDSARLVALTYKASGRVEDAIAAYGDFINEKNFTWVPEDGEVDPKIKTGKSCAATFKLWKKAATYEIGYLRYQQKDYPAAIKQWEHYIGKYPNGKHWSECQNGIIQSQYKMGLDLVAAKKYPAAKTHFEKFLKDYPLDSRSRQILFIFGQIHQVKAVSLEQDDPEKKEDIAKEYSLAVQEWMRLISKYPGTEEASLALLRVAKIQEMQGDLEQALASYMRLKWGSYQSQAAQKVKELTSHNLKLATERVFRTNEEALVKLSGRNLKKVTVSQYFVNLDSYFRKAHKISDIEDLDIDLIEADKSWEVEIKDFEKYKLISQDLKIPFPAGKSGACIIRVHEDEFEATTLVVRSDLDIIAKSSRREALVFIVDRLQNKPAQNVKVLFTDGKKIISSGNTGEDGVFKAKIDGLKNQNDIRVFVQGENGLASTTINLNGLGLSKGMQTKGYIYTDKSAYRPGEKVSFKAIIRDVKDGAYHIPQGSLYKVQIYDPSSRLIKSLELPLNEFGSLDSILQLPKKAKVGQYRLVVRQDKVTYSALFEVQAYRLEKIRTRLEFSKSSYFRGEPVKLKIKSEYYWGEPVVGRLVTYYLPDGRRFTDRTDEHGVIPVHYDASGFAAGSWLAFKASVNGESQLIQKSVLLAAQGFNIEAESLQKLALANDAFELKIKTTDNNQNSVGKNLSLKIYRYAEVKLDKVLTQVPWVNRRQQAALAEKLIEEKDFKTDPKTGEVTLSLKLAEGGDYIFRVTGVDEFKNTISSAARIKISADDDKTRLRFFADKSTYNVGEEIPLQLHSRLEKGLALLTSEGEDIIDYKVINFRKGASQQDIRLENKHFPNFRVAIAAMNGDKLHTAYKDFKVERQLNISVKTDKKVYKPGAKAKVEIEVTDQLGQAVEAEISLALVNEALFDLYKEKRSEIISYFQKSQKRFVEFRVATTAGFRYGGVTKKRQQSIEQERQRLLQKERERQQLLAAQRSSYGTYNNRALVDRTRVMSQQAVSMNFADVQVVNGTIANFQQGQLNVVENADSQTLNLGAENGQDTKRYENILASNWLTGIKTDKQGKATADIVLPTSMTEWRITTIAATKDSLFGENKVNIVTRKDFFIELKLPTFAQEGDVFDVIARIHNLTQFKGELKVSLQVNGNLISQVVDLQKMSLKDVIFKGVKVPAAEFLNLSVSAGMDKMTDNLLTSLPIRPWGIEFRNRTGGVINKSTSTHINLPEGQAYDWRRLIISLSPNLQKGIIDMALANYPQTVAIDQQHHTQIAQPMDGDYVPSDLLAAISAYKYGKNRPGIESEMRQLKEKVEGLMTALIATQEQGGWWYYEGQKSWQFAARAYWALILCQQEGFHVESTSLYKAKAFLEATYRSIHANESDDKAEILFVLALNKQADFSSLNRLYRERVKLNSSGLAYLALAFATLDRQETAGELLALLEKKAVHANGQVYFNAVKDRAYRSGLKTSALALMLYAAIKPKSANAAAIADWLLTQKGALHFASSRFSGPAVAGLTKYYQKIEVEKSDFEAAVYVNNKLIKKVSSKELSESLYLSLPSKLIQPQNKLRIDYKGQGKLHYAATISGFSAEMKNPKSFRKARFRYRNYYHDNLMYKNAPISSSSSTTVTNAEIGQRIHVSESIYKYYSHSQDFVILEEYIPAGMLIVDGSINKGNASRYEREDGKITFFFRPGILPSTIRYQLIAFAPGKYRVLPSVIRDRNNLNRMLLGPQKVINVLAPGEKSTDKYTLNQSEHYEFARLYFKDKNYEKALVHLNYLFEHSPNSELARMLLWIHATDEYYDAAKVVNCFEILREKDPERYIPFDKILVIGKSYRLMKEYERAWLVFRATIDSNFIKDTGISASLEDQGQFLSSIDYLEDLWYEYPDRADVVSAYFAWSNDLFKKAPLAAKLAREEGRIRKILNNNKSIEMPTKIDLLQRSIRLARQFITLYPENPQADDAAFALLNTFFALDDYPRIVRAAQHFIKWHPKSHFKSSFEYMNALGHFWQYQFDDALKLTTMVAAGDSKDQQYAKYITAQIYHTQGKAAEAIDWYKKVKDIYPDAVQSIDYFEEEKVSIDEISSFKPGEEVKLSLSYRNIKEASFQVYKVDLMKLYLREKNLSNITKVNLAGIAPALEMTVQLGAGKDYANKEKEIQLALKDEGAYLIICRGDDLFTSGLVLITPLKLEIQEDEGTGSMRVNVINSVKENFVPKVHVKAIGSSDKDFKSGETDLRGLFVTSGINGLPTVIVRSDKSHYAFYRGKQMLGKVQSQQRQTKNKKIFKMQKQLEINDYLQNSIQFNNQQNDTNINNWYQMRRGSGKGGVQIKMAK